MTDQEIANIMIQDMRLPSDILLPGIPHETNEQVLDSFAKTGQARALLFTFTTILTSIDAGETHGNIVPRIIQKSKEESIITNEEMYKLLAYKGQTFDSIKDDVKKSLSILRKALAEYIVQQKKRGGRRNKKKKGGALLDKSSELEQYLLELLHTDNSSIYNKVPLLLFMVKMALRLYEIVFLIKETRIFSDSEHISPSNEPFSNEGSETISVQLLRMLTKFYHFLFVYLQKTKKSEYDGEWGKGWGEERKLGFLLEKFKHDSIYDNHTRALHRSHTYMTEDEAREQEIKYDSAANDIERLLKATEKFHFAYDKVSVGLPQLKKNHVEAFHTFEEMLKEQAKRRSQPNRLTTPAFVQDMDSKARDDLENAMKDLFDAKNYLNELNHDYDTYYKHLKQYTKPPADLRGKLSLPIFTSSSAAYQYPRDKHVQRSPRERSPGNQGSPRSPRERSPRSPLSPLTIKDDEGPSRSRSRSPAQTRRGGGKIKDCKNTGIKKEILGKSMCIYKIRGSRTEFVRYKKEFVALKVYKAEKKADKKPTKKVERKVVKKAEKKVEKKADKKPTKKVEKKAEKKVVKKAEKKVEKKAEKKVVKKTTGKCEKEKRKISKLQDLCKKCKNIHVGGCK